MTMFRDYIATTVLKNFDETNKDRVHTHKNIHIRAYGDSYSQALDNLLQEVEEIYSYLPGLDINVRLVTHEDFIGGF